MRVWHVTSLACHMFGMSLVWHVTCLACHMFGMSLCDVFFTGAYPLMLGSVAEWVMSVTGL